MLLYYQLGRDSLPVMNLEMLYINTDVNCVPKTQGYNINILFGYYIMFRFVWGSHKTRMILHVYFGIPHVM